MRDECPCCKGKGTVKSGQWCPICNGSGIDPESDLAEEEDE
jgi:RecJ-like exonuclease